MIQLRDYQQRISEGAAEALKNHRIAYLAMEARTGKTLTALAAAQTFGAANVLFITTKKAQPSITADYEAGGFPFSLTVINHDSAHKISGTFDLVVIDEAHRLGAYPKPSLRTQKIKAICKGLPVIFLSGTPTPESYSQIYHQLYVSDSSPFRWCKNFYAFAKVFVNTRKREINGYTINDYSAAKIHAIWPLVAPFWFSYSQKEAGFNSFSRDYYRTIAMKPETVRLIEELKRNRIAHLGDTTIVADTPAKLLDKIHQIGGGTVIDNEGKAHIIDTTKAEYIKRLFEGRKIAVYYLYRAEFEMLKTVFENWTDDPQEFQTSTDKTFLGQLASAREGIRLDTADAIIFYSIAYSYLSYEQTKNRIQSKEREKPSPCFFIFTRGGIDEDIYTAVQDKRDFTTFYYKKKYGRIWG